MAEIINGKIVSQKLRSEIKEEVDSFRSKTGVTPGLAVIIVGSDPASQIYVRNKQRACAEVGINSVVIEYPDGTTESELLSKIDQLNSDSNIHGILVQLPLPENIDEKAIIDRIDPGKDVDAFHPYNVGKIMLGSYDFLPCTPAGIIALLDYYKVDIAGKRCAVIGRSNIVGKPM